MAEMQGRHGMPLPENTLPMMAGRARSARSRWAACSRVIKVRDGRRPRRLSRPGLVSASSRDRGARIRRPDAAACIDSRSGRCRAGAAFRSQASSSAALSRRVRCAAPRGALSAHVTGARHRPRVPARRAHTAAHHTAARHPAAVTPPWARAAARAGPCRRRRPQSRPRTRRSWLPRTRPPRGKPWPRCRATS